MVLSEPKLIIQAMSMNPRMSFRPQEDVKHSPDETDSVTDKEGSFILEPFTVHCIYIKLQTTWIFTGLPTTPTLSPWTDSSKPYCLKQKRFSSSFCPGTMRSDLWSVRCFGTVGKHHHAPWTADFFLGDSWRRFDGSSWHGIEVRWFLQKMSPQVAQLTHVPRRGLPEIDARNGKTYMTGIGHGVLIGVRGNCATISDLDCITI